MLIWQPRVLPLHKWCAGHRVRTFTDQSEGWKHSLLTVVYYVTRQQRELIGRVVIFWVTLNFNYSQLSTVAL